LGTEIGAVEDEKDSIEFIDTGHLAPQDFPGNLLVFGERFRGTDARKIDKGDGFVAGELPDMLLDGDTRIISRFELISRSLAGQPERQCEGNLEHAGCARVIDLARRLMFAGSLFFAHDGATSGGFTADGDEASFQPEDQRITLGSTADSSYR
jgi:hypothetical protein